ncbi:MAG: aspartate aminotransferase family protein [Firmicutes bacterium]|nr:aspartate aminotransferase family protein [Bacillota bacterium]
MALMNTYNRFPLTLVKGKGSYVWTDAGDKYLDYTAGIATCNLGHVPEYVEEKLSHQLAKLWHCSNLYHIPNQEALARLLVENSCADQVFFCNSGAEANEGAIKLARKYGKAVKGAQAYQVVTFKQSFHGRTLATLSATGQKKIQEGFEPLVDGFSYLEFNDFSAIDKLDPATTAAVLLEVVQGEGGVVPADRKWLQELASYCQINNILLMIDEIQTGMGRTGSLFAYQQYGIEPDVFTLAKGLGSGFPIGALLAKEQVAKYFQPGSHGSTFGGNPLAVTAGLATLEYMLNNRIPEQAKELGNYLAEQLKGLQAKYGCVKEVRGLGLLQGLVVEEKAGEIINAARDRKLLILFAGSNVIRILPPLTTTKEEIQEAVTILDQSFQAVFN